MSSTLRSVTFQLHVKNEDGITQMRQFTRSVADADGMLDHLNKTLGDNVTVTRASVDAATEKARMARTEATLFNNTTKTYQSMTAELQKQIALVGKSSLQQAEYNAVMKLGALASKEQVDEITRLIRKLDELEQEERDVIAASDARIKQQREEDAAIARQQQSYESLIREMEHYNRTINMTNAQKREENAIFRLGAGATEAQIQRVRELARATEQLENAQNGAGRSSRQNAQIMQNAGFQIQDALVQAQMGTDASVIIAQQAPQFLSAFGAVGAILGTLVAAGAILTPIVSTMLDGADAADEFAKSQHRLSDAIESTEFNVVGLSDSMQELFLRSKSLAAIRIDQAFDSAKEGVKAYTEQIREAMDGLLQLEEGQQRQGRGFVDSIGNQARALGISRQQFEDLSALAQDALETGHYERLLSFLNVLNDGSTATTSSFKEMFTSVADGAQALILLNDQLEKAKEGTDSLKNSAEVSMAQTKEIIKGYHDQQAALFMTNRERDMERALSQLNEQYTESERRAVERAVNQLHDAIDARELHAEAMANQAKASREAAQKEEQEAQARAQRLQQEIVQRQRLLDLRMKTRDALISGVQGQINGSMSERDQEELNHSQNMGDLNQAMNMSQEPWEYTERARINGLIEQEQIRHNEAMKQIEEAEEALEQEKQQAKLQMYSDALGGLSLFFGEQTAMGQAFLAAQKGMAIAEATISAYDAASKHIAAGDYIGAAAAVAIGLGNVAKIQGVGLYDKGGVIPAGGMGIVSEYGDELVGGTLVMNKSSSGMPVTGREKTASLMERNGVGGGGNTIIQNITVNGNGDKALADALKKAAADGAEMGYNKVARDFTTGRGIRSQLKRTAGI